MKYQIHKETDQHYIDSSSLSCVVPRKKLNYNLLACVGSVGRALLIVCVTFPLHSSSSARFKFELHRWRVLGFYSKNMSLL